LKPDTEYGIITALKKVLKGVLAMKAIAAQEIKRRGITAVDEALKEGPVHIIKNNRPEYVVVSEERYQELLEAEDEAYIARIKASLEDVKAGRIRKFKSADELLKALDEEADD
jgi:PHD/YefM family antitoxin component YafN of YafNO toxin-antitoxin module